MKFGWWMLAGSVLSCFAITILVRAQGPEVWLGIWLGMIAPLIAAIGTWFAVERTFKKQPEGVSATLFKAFVAKAVFFGGYLAVAIKLVGVSPIPFVASFFGYFVALHFVEAFRLRRLFVGV